MAKEIISKEDKIKCEYCKKTFKSEKNLTKHSQNKCKAQIKQEIDKVSESFASSPFPAKSKNKNEYINQDNLELIEAYERLATSILMCNIMMDLNRDILEDFNHPIYDKIHNLIVEHFGDDDI